MGPTLTPVANATTVQIVKDFAPKFARVRVATVGAAVTLGYVTLKALGA
jgi:hypothetical protein